MAHLNNDQFKAFQLIEQGHSVLVTGQAGTGKSFLVKYIEKALSQKGKNVSVTATTGIAAQLFKNGQVIHSWAGLLDGRYTNSDLLNRLQLSEQRDAATRIRTVDVLIIDEISMLSQKIFEQLEFICRKMRSDRDTHYFGGIQIVCVGDFFQLPPVPNDLYHDPGIPVFHSNIFKNSVPHKITLSDVLRQSESDLVRAINELERGCPSVETNNFMYNLCRLSNSKPDVPKVFLYGTNFEVDCHNSQELQRIPGERSIFNSIDSGDKKLLSKVRAKHILQLKVNCPVVLLRNLTSTLANGTMGIVLKIEEDGPTVRFQGKAIKMERHSFSVYSPDEDRVLAQRHQFPIALAFALTVHKAQGSTIPNLVIDCRNMFQSGQLGVAVGRAVNSDGLQVLHYSPSACKKHRKEVVEFCENKLGCEALLDGSCCDRVYEENSGTITTSDPVTVSQDEEDDFSDDSSFTKDEQFLLTLEELERSLPEVDEADDPGPARTTDPPPTKFSSGEARDMLESLITKEPVTEQQQKLNESVSDLKLNLENVRTFLDFHFNEISEIKKDSSLDQGSTTKKWTTFYRSFHSYTESDRFKKASKELYGVKSQNDLLTGNLVTKLRKLIVQSVQPSEGTSAEASVQSEQTTAIPVSAYGKIRYVGGRAIAKTKYHYTSMAKRQLESTGVLQNPGMRVKVTLLQLLTVDQADILEKTIYPESVIDTHRKQNLRCSLTNVTDKTFEFFLLLEKTRLPLYRLKENLPLHGEDILINVHKTVNSDAELYQSYVKLFKDVNTSLFDQSDDYQTVVVDIVEASMAIKELFDDITTSYLNVTDSEYRKKLNAQFGKKTTMEHRKQVLTKALKSGVLSYSSILEDMSDRKIASHYKLKGAVLDNKESLQKLTKGEMVSIGQGYDITLKATNKKDVLVEQLTKRIVDADFIPCPEKLAKTLKQASGPSASDQASGSTDLSKSVPVPESASPTVISAGDSLDPATIDPAQPGSSKGRTHKRKGCGKEKGKGKASKSTCKRPTIQKQIFDEVDSDFCALCGEMYYEDDPEPWVGCSYCDRWWHRHCGGLGDQANWEQYSQEGVSWTCPKCS